MTIRKHTNVTVTIRGYSEEDVRYQVREHFGLVEPGYSTPEVPALGEVKTTKLNLVRFLREFEKRYHLTGSTTLMGLKTFTEEFFNI